MDQFADVLANEIKPGEEVLWREQPRAKRIFKTVLKRNMAKIWLLSLFLGLGLMIIYGAPGSGTTVIVLCILCVLYVIVLLQLLSKPIAYYVMARTWLYVITTQRVLIIKLSPKISVISYATKDVINNNYSKLYHPDGSGEITLAGAKRVTLAALNNVKAVSDVIDKLIPQIA